MCNKGDCVLILECVKYARVIQVRSKRRSTRVPNRTDELSWAEERRLNQFGPAVLIRLGKQRVDC